MKINWKQIGKVIGVFVSLYTTIKDTLSSIKVGPEVVAWLVGGGKNFFIEKIIEIGEEFKRRMPVFPTWKIARLIIGLKTAEDFRKAIKACGYEIIDWADDAIARHKFCPGDGEKIELVNVTVAELGFKDEAANMWEIEGRAKELGLTHCSVEVALEFCSLYNGPVDEKGIRIHMKPIPGRYNKHDVCSGTFSVRNYGGKRVVSAYIGNAANLFVPEDRLILAREST